MGGVLVWFRDQLQHFLAGGGNADLSRFLKTLNGGDLPICMRKFHAF